MIVLILGSSYLEIIFSGIGIASSHNFIRCNCILILQCVTIFFVKNVINMAEL